MTRYQDSLGVERRGWESVRSWLSGSFCDEGRYVLTDKGRLAPEIQQKYGDIVTQRRGQMVWVEMKTEERYTGNFFIEDWSNWSRGNPGWFHKLDTDLLFYQFLDNQSLYLVDFRSLRQWLMSGNPTGNRFSKYRMVKQSKCDQLNDTWGRLVPVIDVMESREVRSHIVYLGVEIGPRTPAFTQQALGF